MPVLILSVDPDSGYAGHLRRQRTRSVMAYVDHTAPRNRSDRAAFTDVAIKVFFDDVVADVDTARAVTVRCGTALVLSPCSCGVVTLCLCVVVTLCLCVVVTLCSCVVNGICSRVATLCLCVAVTLRCGVSPR